MNSPGSREAGGSDRDSLAFEAFEGAILGVGLRFARGYYAYGDFPASVGRALKNENWGRIPRSVAPDAAMGQSMTQRSSLR
jgi:hypothetical protein